MSEPKKTANLPIPSKTGPQRPANTPIVKERAPMKAFFSTVLVILLSVGCPLAATVAYQKYLRTFAASTGVALTPEKPMGEKIANTAEKVAKEANTDDDDAPIPDKPIAEWIKARRVLMPRLEKTLPVPSAPLALMRDRQCNRSVRCYGSGQGGSPRSGPGPREPRINCETCHPSADPCIER